MTALAALTAPHATAPLLRPPRPPRPRLASGYPALDALDLVRPGRVAFLDAPPDRVLYRHVAAATLAGDVLVVDGGNRFDAFDLAEVAPAAGAVPDDALARTWVARAFTPYQMQALLEETAGRWLSEGRACELLVCGVVEQYLDEDTPRREGLVLYRRALRALRALAGSSCAPVVLTNHASGLHRRRGFLEMTLEAVDEAALFARKERGACTVLLPKEGRALVCRAADAAESSLDRWLEA